MLKNICEDGGELSLCKPFPRVVWTSDGMSSKRFEITLAHTSMLDSKSAVHVTHYNGLRLLNMHAALKKEKNMQHYVNKISH